MTTRKAVLAIGIDPTGSHIPGPAHVQKVAAQPEVLREMLKVQLQHISDAGYDFDFKQVKPQDFDSCIEWLAEKLKSRPWDIFIVGGGIRQTPDFTPFFEKVVNTAREVAPGVKLGFNTKPDDLYETILRLS